MLSDDLVDIGPEEIQRLLDNQVEESLTLDYKQELPGDSGDARREFLYDVVAFANASGGYIIFGISDRREAGKSTGLPERIVGLADPNLQDARVRLENMIRDGIAPRVEVSFKLIDLPAARVLVARVHRSWAAPHMVIYQKANKFYVRGNSDKELMNIEQIRSSFLQRRELSDRIRSWRMERLELIGSGDAPVPLRSNTCLVVHAVSSKYFLENRLPSSWVFPPNLRSLLRLPVISSGSYPIYNADGFLQHSYIHGNAKGFDAHGAAAYVQVFRSGALEFVHSGISFKHETLEGTQISLVELEKGIVDSFENVATHAERFGLEAPAYFAVSLIGLKGTRFYLGRSWMFEQLATVQTDRFLVPEFLLETPTEPKPFPSTLRPIADTLAQVAGLEGSPYVDGLGCWNPMEAGRR